MDDPAFAPGFRFSTIDLVVLVVGTATTIGFVFVDFWFGVAIAFIVLHFFLFCNILRMSRPLELLWAGMFVVLAAFATAERIAWPLAFGASMVTTILVTLIEMRRPSYHGVAWKIINPQLPEWWYAQRAGGETPHSR